MSALSWVRLARRIPGVVRQKELTNLETLIDIEAGRQPARNLFVLSCAIPAGIAIFGGFSVFAARVSGSTGLPLILGTLLTVVIAAGSWFTFYRLYRAIPPTTRRLRDLIFKFSKRYATVGNILLGENLLDDSFADMLDEVAGYYLRHCVQPGEPPAYRRPNVSQAIEATLLRLMEAAEEEPREAQTQALVWGQPLLDEVRLLDKALTENKMASKQQAVDDPLEKLRQARWEVETGIQAEEELDQHLRN